ncbi:MAG: tetratricopeptide repeat protein [Candidatus Omnitrophota bacterium]|nr:tetratricopeptide repeat protein [Candidatus Omnitrophota bacterium]MDZ4243119.1 tetratricopeptide repeat protein [Candidatus Omnitrophota bacterium]
MTKADKRNILLITLLAMGLRLAYVFLLRHNYFFVDHPSSDVLYYHEWAKEIAWGKGEGLKTFWGLPLYPHFLAVLERITLGHAPGLIRFTHFLLGSANCALVYVLCAAIFSRTTALLAGILAAANFTLIHFDWLMMPVPLLIFLSLIIVISLIRSQEDAGARDFLLIGFLIGLACLGDGKFLFFLGLICLRDVIRDRKDIPRIFFKRIIPVIAGAAIVLGGFTVRNRIVFGDWIFISAQSGLSFYVGNNPVASGIFENPDFIRPTHHGQDEDQQIVAQAVAEKTMGPAEISSFWKKTAGAYIRENPAGWGRLLAQKFLLFFNDQERAHDIDLILQRDLRLRMDLNPYFLLCPMALLGMVLAWRSSRQNGVINLLLFSQLLVTIVFFLTTRHRATVLPYFLIYQAYFVLWVIGRWKNKKTTPVAISIAAIAVFVLLFPPKFVDQDSYRFLVHAKSGPIYAKKGDLPKARQNYFFALELRPSDTNTLYNLANTYLQEEDYNRAEIFYLKALETCHYNVDALFNLGVTYEKLNAPNRAIQIFQKALQYQPGSLDVHYRLGRLYLGLGQCDVANRHFQFLLQRQPALEPDIRPLMEQCPGPHL